MRVLLTGGGTGGHIYPALAIGKALQADDTIESILYIGKKDGLEATLVEKTGLRFMGISFSGMPRKNPIKWLFWAFQLQLAIWEAKKILRNEKPDIVFGTGGYVSAPVLMAAKALKIPYIIHEPDACPGLANKSMAGHAKIVTSAFEEAKNQMKLGRNTRFAATGNPVSLSPGHLSKSEALEALGLTEWDANRNTILIFGGSQGARSINTAIANVIHQLVFDLGCQVFHIAGNTLYEETTMLLDENISKHPRYKLTPFCHQMPLAMAISDIAICRSGSVSLSELYIAGLPSILIPFPYAAADHQRKNALQSVRQGASVMIEDHKLNGNTLLKQLRDIFQSPYIINSMKEAALSLAHPNATEDIVDLIKEFN